MKTTPSAVQKKGSLGTTLFAQLTKTRGNLQGRLSSFFTATSLDDTQFDDLHSQLLLADVGVDASDQIIKRLRRAAKAQHLTTSVQLHAALRAALLEILTPCEQPLVVATESPPFVILMVGVNGTGKTTTLAKLAHRLSDQGNTVMLAACDTFRAAAIEQLQTWGQRLEVPVVAQAQGADAAAVAYDAYRAACARAIDVLLIDTAGRQHTHGDLMEQLMKLVRVLRKANPAVPNEVLLTVDAGNGHNALSQVEHFHQSVGVSGVCASKLDGTAKGGMMVALAARFGLPIRYIGVGQERADLQQFSADEFVSALLPTAE